MLGFMKGKKEAYTEGDRVPQIKMYRRSLEALTKMRPSASLVKLPMKPEEQVAMELARDTAGDSGKADAIKDTKGGTDAPKLSAKVTDPELQKLLQSV